MLLGRSEEQARIDALLDGARDSRSGVLVVRGEPGIGKTALLDHAREQASDMHVLTARGVESESDLPFAGLHQLLRPALHLLDGLPTPQATALRRALGLEAGVADERFLISAACLTLLSELADDRPVTCLVDDVQWLDTPSADALVFVARRLSAEGIAMLFAVREGEAQRFEARELPELELRGLDSGTAVELLEGRVSSTLGDGVRDLLVERADGNALALVELGTALSAAQLAGDEPLPDTLPLTRGIEQLFLARVRRLPEPTQKLLLLLSADDAGALAPVLHAAEELGLPADAIDAAEVAGLVSVEGANVSFQHPLVRSAVYQSASSSERRAAHLALAKHLSSELEADQRAWHRAAAALEPSEDVAADLERAAERARGRGGHAAAAAALARAAVLSEESRSRARRQVAAAAASWSAGQPGRASFLLDQAGSESLDPALRGDIEHLRGVIALWSGNLLSACDTLIGASAEVAGHDPAKALAMLFDGAVATGWAGDFRRLAEIGRHAAALPATGTREQAFLTSLLVAIGGLWEAKTVDDVPLILEVVELADQFDEPRWLLFVSSAATNTGADQRALALQQRSVAIARASGAVDTLAHVLVVVAANGLLSGRAAVTAEAVEGLELAREVSLPTATTVCLAVLSWFAAVRGDEETCRSYAEEAAAGCEASGNAFARSLAVWGLGLLELGAGRPAEACTHLETLTAAQPGATHPYIALLSARDLIEACVRTGRHEEANAPFAVLSAFAQPAAPPWALALAAHSRALLSQDPATATAEFEAALRLHTSGDRSFDRARTELSFGEHLRRRRQRLDAREHLRAALREFESLGAKPWAERARAELRASGETARRRDPTTVDQLTPQELQIARFVAEGLSNKEVAALLFLSPRTIDYHLRHVFAKLGITSRAQLSQLPLRDEVSATDVRAAAPA